VALALWATVAEVDEEVLLDVVERAVEAHLVEETPDGTAIRFRHALIRETLYDGLPASRRRVWHRRAGETLAAAGRDVSASDPGAVAEYFAQAGDPRAVLWLTRAAERALRSSDSPTAIRRFAQAVSLLRVSGDDEATRGWLLYRLGRLRRYSDVAAGLAHFAEAEEIAIARGDRALLVLTAFGRALLHISPGQIHWGLAEMAKALADWETLTPDALAVLQAHQVGPGSEPPWGTLALTLALIGRFGEARKIAERVIGGPAPAPPGSRLEDFPWGDAHLALGHIHTMHGAFDEASAAYERARGAYRAAAHHLLVGHSAARELDAVLRYATDDLAARARLAAEAEEMLGRANGVRGGLSPRVARLPLLLLEGRWTEARELAEMAQARSDSRELVAATVLGVLARAQGDAATAWRIVAQQLPAGLATPPGGAIFADALVLIELAVGLALDANDLSTMRSWLEVYDRWLAWGRASAGACEGRLAWARYYRAMGDLTRARTG
jgi:tetratricopeptide (TPR) repeat protein